jgi:hypothetical protein
MRAAHPETGRQVLIGLLCLASAVLLVIWWNGYVIDVFGRTTDARVRLFAMSQDAMNGSGRVVGTVDSGTQCCLVQVEVKGLAAFRIKCADGLTGWTDEAQAFDPPLRVGLFGR